MHYIPLSLPFFMAFVFLFALVIVLVEIGILKYAYEQIGVSRRYMFALLLVSILGSYVNIPVAELPAEHLHSGQVVTFFGMQYVVPLVIDSPRTIVALNLGGAIIPILLSAYLILKNKMFVKSLIAVSIVTIVVHQLAHAVPGVGIAEPTFVPPLVTVAVVLLISRRQAAPLAYVAGSLGTLIGADLLNLGKIQGLGAPIASIGGAGTFDGIFLTGILAVLLASMLTPRKPAPSAGKNKPRPEGGA
ncbi:MAG: DUF1614 domain-containing protein [Deltaproteobacteria bacterium]|jgi:uncharacterized membrane protein